MLSGAEHKGVRDFLADVTAFANTDSGDIVIGVREDKNGVAAEIVGIEKDGLDEGLRRVDDQLRSCVDSRSAIPSARNSARWWPRGACDARCREHDRAASRGL